MLYSNLFASKGKAVEVLTHIPVLGVFESFAKESRRQVDDEVVEGHLATYDFGLQERLETDSWYPNSVPFEVATL